jgi:hypothetical protein
MNIKTLHYYVVKIHYSDYSEQYNNILFIVI